MIVKALVNHIEPGILRYREAGEEFDTAKLYKHVEPLEKPVTKKVTAKKDADAE